MKWKLLRPVRLAIRMAFLAVGPVFLAACGLKSSEPYEGPGKLPGTWYHEVAGFSDFPHTDTYKFREDGVLLFQYESSKFPSYSWTGKWELREDSLFATRDSCGVNPNTQVAILDCRLPLGYDVRWEPVIKRVYQLTENGPLFLTNMR